MNRDPEPSRDRVGLVLELLEQAGAGFFLGVALALSTVIYALERLQ